MSEFFIMDETIRKQLSKELKIHAHAIGLPEGSAESFIKATINAVQKSLKSKSTITDSDLTRLVAKELKKYNQDLAYVYQNHDKII